MAADRACVMSWIQRSAAVLHEQRDYLTSLDAAIGDADHGINMDRGFTAVLAKLQDLTDADVGTILKTVGTTLVSTVGGASGPLYGTAFLRAGVALAGKQELLVSDVADGLRAALDGIVARGHAQLGEKTMVDALSPAVDVFTARVGQELDEALRAATEAAEEGMRQTIPMVATKGRASYLGERSAGHQDPGATSVVFLLRAMSGGR